MPRVSASEPLRCECPRGEHMILCPVQRYPDDDETTIALPVRKRRRNETTIVRASIVALNRLPGVAATRNNVGRSPVACTYCRAKLCPRCAPRLTYPIPFGLAIGSSDIVGVYTAIDGGGLAWPLVFGIEVKAPGGTTKPEHLKDQERWMRVMTLRGIPCAMVTSSEEATTRVRTMITIWTTRLLAYLPAGASLSPLDTRGLRAHASANRSTDSTRSRRRTTKKGSEPAGSTQS